MKTKNYSKKAVFFLIAFLVSLSQFSQSEPEILKNWTALEEAEFHYDVSYSVVKCSPDSKATVLINAFNEDGTHTKVGFTLIFSDASGNSTEIIIKPFASNLGDMKIASCESDENSNLKFNYPEGIDLSTLKITITYQTQS